MTRQEIERAFKIIEEAAAEGERCPQDHPFGPLPKNSISYLVQLGWIRSEVSSRNFRRVVIEAGPHAGKATAPHPSGVPPWKINGIRVDSPRWPVRRKRFG